MEEKIEQSTSQEYIRKQSSLKSKLQKYCKSSQIKTGDSLLLHWKSDRGVALNGGRKGARFAPEAIINSLCKLSNSSLNKEMTIWNQEITMEEISDIKREQEYASKKIKEMIGQLDLKKDLPLNIIQLGGGHDHIYPLLKSLENSFQNMAILNLDPHTDTRIDPNPHSGTPFRQFGEETKNKSHLFQIGTKAYANPASNFDAFKNPNFKMTIIHFENMKNLLSQLDEHLSHEKFDALILSLDCDIIKSSTMEGVSAVAHQGMSVQEIDAIFEWYREKTKQTLSFIGIYEYNPVYDNLSQKGSRYIASLIYKMIVGKNR